MNLLHKFYDIGATDTGGGTEVVHEPSVAELMAKQGYNSDNRPAPQVQVEDKRDNEPEQTEVDVQAALVSTEAKVEDVVQETKPPIEAVVAQTVQPQTTVSWQEVLKQQQPDTVLKELGFDDSKIGLIQKLKQIDPAMVNFLNVWESKGDVAAYVREWTTDYLKMSSEDVMRNQLRNEYPEASEKSLNALFKHEVVEAYKIDPDKYSEEEVEEGRLLLDARADKYRKVLIQNQQAKTLPPPPEAAAEIEADNSEEIEAAKKFEERKSFVANDPFVKNMFATKQFTFGEGDEAFNFPIDPIGITDILYNGEKWAEAINDVALDERGQKVYRPKPQHQALVSMVAKYGMGFFDAYAQHFKTIGSKKAIDPIDNARPPQNNNSSASVIQPQTAAEAMAKAGRLV